jgi:hypothetical protein
MAATASYNMEIWEGTFTDEEIEGFRRFLADNAR